MQCKRLAVAAITAVLLAAIFVSGCGRGNFVTINGDKVTKDEFYTRLERTMIPDGRGGVGQAGPLVLDKIITEKIWEQIAKDKRVYPSEQQVNRKIEFQKKHGNLAATLSQQGLTLDEYKKLVRAQLAMFNVITKDTRVPESEIREAYDRNKGKPPITQLEQTKIGAIICYSEPKIRKAYDRLKQGMDFGTVASTMSEDDASRQNKGEIGWVWIGRPGVPSVLTGTASKLKINDYGEPFSLKENGKVVQWVILRALDRRPKVTVSFEDMREEIREALAMAKAQRQANIPGMLQEKLKTSRIEIHSPKYKGYEKAIERAKKPATRPSAK